MRQGGGDIHQGAGLNLTGLSIPASVCLCFASRVWISTFLSIKFSCDGSPRSIHHSPCDSCCFQVDQVYVPEAGTKENFATTRIDRGTVKEKSEESCAPFCLIVGISLHFFSLPCFALALGLSLVVDPCLDLIAKAVEGDTQRGEGALFSAIVISSIESKPLVTTPTED